MKCTSVLGCRPSPGSEGSAIPSTFMCLGVPSEEVSCFVVFHHTCKYFLTCSGGINRTPPHLSPSRGLLAFSLTLAIIFGAVGILVLIIFIVVSQQHRYDPSSAPTVSKVCSILHLSSACLSCHRLMMILLPPVPAPKIKGINSQMLKVCCWVYYLL